MIIFSPELLTVLGRGVASRLAEALDKIVHRVEGQRFRDFLPTKNGCMVFGLVGGDNNVA